MSVASACHRDGRGSRHAGDPEAEAHDDTLRGAKGETRSAARRIASARCAREERCNNVGADRKYASVDACDDQIRTEWANDLNAYECPNGVVEKELEECLGAIRDEECNSPFDSLSRIGECMAGQICAN
jgi:hypothetical protein